MSKSNSKKILPEKSKAKKLTLKQKKFTAEVIKTGNATQSAIKAGYSERSAQEIGYENLRKPQIQAEIQSATAKLGIDAEYVLGNFKEIADFNKQKRVKAKQINGETYNEEEMIDASAAIKSTEMLGKHLNLFTEKSEVKIDLKDETVSEDRQLALAKKIALLLQKPKI